MRVPRLLQDLSAFWGLSGSQCKHLWRAFDQPHWFWSVRWKGWLVRADQQRLRPQVALR
jgi:hypothetical protein